MNRRGFLAAGAGTLLALPGCFGSSNRSLPETPTGRWRQHASDAQRTGSTSVSVPERGNVAWARGEAGTAAPLVDGEAVFSVGDEATALDAQTGEELWRTELSGQAEVTPALDDDQLVVATDEELRGLGRADGEELWSTTIARPADGVPTLVADPHVVAVPLADAGLVAFDADGGDELWRERALGASAAALVDGTLVFTGYLEDSDTGVLRGVSATDGERDWEVELERPDCTPLVADDEVLVGDAGTLAVHDPDDGSRRRSLGTFGDRIDAMPAVADGIAFLGGSVNEFLAVSLDDGSTEWRVEAGVIGDAAIAVGEDAVVASLESLPEASLAGVAAFDREDGTVLWEHQIEGFDAFPSTPPVLSEDAVYYANNQRSGVVALGDLPPRDDE